MGIVIQFATRRLRDVCERPEAESDLDEEAASALIAVLAMARLVGTVAELVAMLGPACSQRSGALRVVLGAEHVLRMREMPSVGRAATPRVQIRSIKREGN